MLLGALLGAFTAIALVGIYFLANVVAGLPFVPFDIFDQLSRVLPGGIITLFIETMVAVIRVLNLGPTADVAKLIEQVMGAGLWVLVGALFGAILGWIQTRRALAASRVGILGGLILLVAVAMLESPRDDQANPLLGVMWEAVTIVGWAALLGRWVEAAVGGVAPGELAESSERGASRRAFIIRIAATSLAVAAAFLGVGRFLQEGRRSTGAGTPLTGVAQATPPAQPVAGRTIQPVPGTRAEVTPNDKFYRIDINLISPTLHEDSWSLGVDGLFDRARRLSLADLMAYPAISEPRTLSCISNPVGGDLIGNAYWTGLRIPELMKDLGIRPEATALRVESADRFFETVTMADLSDPRTLLVYGMNGTTLPVEHGFPLRILIPNRYGMKQPKWITRFTAIDREELGYWVVRGWSKEARPQIVSVIDTTNKDLISSGRLPLGGIAWAGDRGITKVEVQVDGGQWTEAELIQPPLGSLTWVQWRYEWPASPGNHTFRVRATDGTGALQIERETPSEPDGATGYHSVSQSI